jgi:hypothetical protein
MVKRFTICKHLESLGCEMVKRFIISSFCEGLPPEGYAASAFPA